MKIRHAYNNKLSPQVLKALLLSLGLAMANSVLAQDVPDLNGLWFPKRGPGFDVGQTPGQTPFNDFGQKKYDEYVAAIDVKDDPGGFCIKPGLARSIWGAPFPVEIIQTESFINMFWEGYFQYRKIYMEGFPRPEPILHSGMGYSVGHWEDDVLVVETSYLREYPYMRSLANSEDATIVERISISTLTDEDGVSQRYLNNQLTLTDPTLYSEPVMVKGILAFSPDTPIMEYSCSEEIYDQHLLENGMPLPDLSQ